MSKMSELDLMIRGQIEPIHNRVLALQKEIIEVKHAAYADHRLVEKMNDRLNAQQATTNTLRKMIDVLIKQLEDDGK